MFVHMFYTLARVLKHNSLLGLIIIIVYVNYVLHIRKSTCLPFENCEKVKSYGELLSANTVGPFVLSFSGSCYLIVFSKC